MVEPTPVTICDNLLILKKLVGVYRVYAKKLAIFAENSAKMNPNSLVSISDLSKEQMLNLLELARYFEEHPNHKILDGRVVATLFFEPSTRTRLSFETAVNRLGGRIIGFSDASTTSSSKGETLKDTIIMVSNYVDLIIMRHYLEGAARYATEVTDVPIINAGDGAHQRSFPNDA